MAPDPTWRRPPPGPLAVAADEVHVWRAPLRAAPGEMERFRAVMSEDERARAARFRMDVHRDAFVAGRGAQREILSRYLDISSRDLRFRYSAHGKPELDGAAAESGIRFNVSNSGEMALYAITAGRELGVDLEQLKPVPDGLSIARRFFSAPENEVFAALAEDARDLAFLQCWTRKEAYIKAVGEGLSMPLDCFDVAFTPGEPARLLRTRGDPAEAARWTMLELHPGPGYVGALIAEGNDWRAVLRDYAPSLPPAS